MIKDKMTKKMMQDELNALNQFTVECREDMHEPDEQGLSASVVGTDFNNADGDVLDSNLLLEGRQEIVVILRSDEREEGTGFRITHKINLASLVALAKQAVL